MQCHSSMVNSSGTGSILRAWHQANWLAVRTIARHISQSTLDRLSPVVGQVSIMYRLTCQPSGNLHVGHVSIAGRSRCQSLVSIDTRSRVSLVHRIWKLFMQQNRCQTLSQRAIHCCHSHWTLQFPILSYESSAQRIICMHRALLLHHNIYHCVFPWNINTCTHGGVLVWMPPTSQLQSSIQFTFRSIFFCIILFD